MSRKKTSNENYDLCISDLFCGVLFIFILLLTYFALQFQQKTSSLSKPIQERDKLLEQLEKRLQDMNIKVEIDKDEGILRLKDFFSDCTYFKPAKYRITQCGKSNFEKLD